MKTHRKYVGRSLHLIAKTMLMVSLVSLSSSFGEDARVGGGAPGYAIAWYSIDGGAGRMSGGGFELSATLGQPDASPVPITGGGFGLVGGFLAVAATAPPPTTPGDLDGDGDVDLDDFGTFAACYNGANNPPAPSCPPGVDADLDDDGDVDLDDFSIFAANYTGAL